MAAGLRLPRSSHGILDTPSVVPDIQHLCCKALKYVSEIIMFVCYTTGVNCIKELLLENKSITSLNIWGSQIFDEGAFIISEGLRYNHSLTALNLKHCRMSVLGNAIVYLDVVEM